MSMRYYNKSLASLLLLEQKDQVLIGGGLPKGEIPISEEDKQRIIKRLKHSKGSTTGGVAERIVQIVTDGKNTNPNFADQSPFVDIEKGNVFYSVKGAELNTPLVKVLQNSRNLGAVQFSKFFGDEPDLDSYVSLVCVSYNKDSGELEFLEFGPTRADVVLENLKENGSIESTKTAQLVFGTASTRGRVSPTSRIELLPKNANLGSLGAPRARNNTEEKHAKVKPRLEDLFFASTGKELVKAIDDMAKVLKRSRDELSPEGPSPFKD